MTSRHESGALHLASSQSFRAGSSAGACRETARRLSLRKSRAKNRGYRFLVLGNLRRCAHPRISAAIAQQRETEPCTSCVTRTAQPGKPRRGCSVDDKWFAKV